MTSRVRGIGLTDTGEFNGLGFDKWAKYPSHRRDTMFANQDAQDVRAKAFGDLPTNTLLGMGNYMGKGYSPDDAFALFTDDREEYSREEYR